MYNGLVRCLLAMSAAMGMACYAPIVPEGTVCDSSAHCPSGMTCINNSCTRGSGASDGSMGPPDGSTDSVMGDAMIDATIDAPQGCSPAGFSCTGGYSLSSCSGMCFIRCTNPVSRTDAQQRCMAWGGTLATLDTMAANTCANQATTPLSSIGLQQTAGADSTAADWSWTGAQVGALTAWATGQPDDADATENGQEDCGAAIGGEWEDVDCATPLGFICRR